MLKSEDRNNRYMRTCGDCLEYFLREEIFVILCAYVQTNTPPCDTCSHGIGRCRHGALL